MNKPIKTEVTEQGVLIPREFLEGIKEVEIRKENNAIVVTPTSEPDPIRELGEHPVECGVSDASEDHDRYLYGNTS